MREGGPFAYFVRHPAVYTLSTAAASTTAVYAAIRACRSHERARRAAFAALSVNCAVQAAWLTVGTERRRRSRA